VTKFVVVRHGETVWNAAGRIQGHLDSPLNTEGLAQAELLAECLAQERFDAVYCSDLGRTQQTIQPYLRKTGASVVLCPRLRERHLGVLQGFTAAESSSRFPDVYARFHARESEYLVPQGESIRDVFERTRQRFEDLAAEHPGQSVLVVTHGGILDVLNRFVRGIALDHPRDFTVYNSSINRLRHADGKWSIEKWGDISHLTRDAALDDF
jgi:2,3-bisphosphoglycerate-dependent phosphoglycerate mutase